MAKRTTPTPQLNLGTAVTWKVERITAPVARELLAGMVLNRPHRQRRSRMWATDMVEGRWHLTHQAIAANTSGQLIDGQHRLWAVVYADELESGFSIDLYVARNVSPEAFDLVDLGAPRTVGEIAHTHGVANAKIVAAATRVVLRYENWPQRVWSALPDEQSKAAQEEFIQKNRDQVDVLDCNVPACLGRGARTTWAALHWLVLRHSDAVELWNDWAEGVKVGANLNPGDPRLVLRSRGNPPGDDWWASGGPAGRVRESVECVPGRSAREAAAFHAAGLSMPELL